MAVHFTPAVRTMAKLRMALAGVAGSGKTLSALLIAKGLGGTVALLDTEAHSSTKYAGDPDVPPFDVLGLETFHPQRYIEAIEAAEKAGYDILIIDGLSPAWAGKDGVLDLVEAARVKSKSGNAFSDGWRVVSPLHQQLMDRILQSSIDIICTVRTKQEYVIEEREGKKVPVKKGMEMVQRNDTDYLFDLVGEFNTDHTLVITKSRCRMLSDQIIPLPGATLGEQIRAWLRQGAPTNGHQAQAASPVNDAERGRADHDRDIPHPSKDQMDALQSLAKSVSIDEPEFWRQIKRMMNIPEGEKISKSDIRARMTMSEYEAARVEYSSRLKAAVEHEEDVPNFPPPSSPHEPASPAGDMAEASAEDHGETGIQEDAEGTGYATQAQVSQLELLAQGAGDKAYADLQDTLEHYQAGLPVKVHDDVLAYLKGLNAKAKEAQTLKKE